MDWKKARRSDNVQDYRGGGGGGGGFRMGGRGISLGGLAAIFGIGLLLGKSPLEMLSLLTQLEGGSPAVQQAPSPANQQSREFVSAILGETEDVWGALFQKAGGHYEQPRLILFSGRVGTACGGASSASGPFYCPADHQVYLDAGFFDEMTAQLGGGGDFANAYVIAHEVGHHVQTLLGTSQRLSGRDTRGADGLSVRLELQADCYAGVWAYHAQQRHQWLQAGDIEEALNTASAIGDDRLQKRSQGEVVPDAFTHGSSEQRVRWFRTGFESGEPGRCDTFTVKKL